jgi:lipopolysaccharide/colanic/teichoic acid biosynthesis glycosyltransferase
VISPFILFLYTRKLNFIRSLFQILLGKKSFIGFSDAVTKRDVRLPKIKPGILSPADSLSGNDQSIHEKLNLLYSRDYSMRKDFSILLKSWKKLDK